MRKNRIPHYFDYSLLFIILFLAGFGLVMIYSASSYSAFETNQDPAFYLKKQGIAVIIGLIIMIALTFLDYHRWMKYALFGYVVTVVLIFLVKTPLGVSSHGATRWIKVPGTGLNIQPAEVAKLGMILFLAVVVCKIGKKIKSWKGFLIMMALPFPAALLVYVITDNLSSAAIIMFISLAMVFVASPDYKKFILIALAGAVLLALLLFLIFNVGLGGFRAERVLAWRDPEAYVRGKGFQTMQALYAIGSGGVFGKGLGQSMQKLNYIPESQNDMIFSIICEELGMFGAITILILFAIMIWRMMTIANNAPDMFGGMLVVGVMAHIAVQVILNVAVVTNTIPNTGISLPFISYGGSSVMFLFAELGLVMSVSRQIELKEE